MHASRFPPVISLLCLHTSLLADPVTYQDGKLANGIVSVDFEKQGTFAIQDAQTGEPLLNGTGDGTRRSAVWGGLRYREFGADALLHDGSPAFYSEDPIGCLIDEDETWFAHDTHYLDVHTRDPFEALER